MTFAMGWLGIVLALQIPPPDVGPDRASNFKSDRRTIIEREAADLATLAARLDRDKHPETAKEVRAMIVRVTNSDSLTHFHPLAEAAKVGTSPLGLASVKVDRSPPTKAAKPAEPSAAVTSELATIRKRSSDALLELARRAAASKSPHWELASECVRDVLARDPNHAEARRLLGFEPHEGGWARPFAIRQLKAGNVLHPTYGWVPASWVPQLEAGKLPAPPSTSRNPKTTRWLPAEEANRLRANGNPPWLITTEHFEIQSNVPLSETIAFGRRLEDFYDLFFTVMADAVGNQLPLARRLREPASRSSATYRPHLVYYFATKGQYLAHLRNIAPPDIDKSLGYYDPLSPVGQKTRKPAYFFRDEGGQIDAMATLYHEVSHQLLFESAGGATAYKKNIGNYWVFEGLGTFFETVTTHPDGSMEVGGVVGPRIDAAVQHIAEKGNAIPTALFVGLGQEVFNREMLIYANYQQAMALTLFLMRWHDGIYRDAFLDYVRDALKGSLRVESGRTLQDRLGTPYETIDAQFLEFFKEQNEARVTKSKPGPLPAE